MQIERMFEFIRETISICIQKIKGFVEREENVLNDAIDNVEKPVVVVDTCGESHDIENIEKPVINENVSLFVVDDDKCKEESRDINNDQEPEVVIVYEKLRKYPLKRSFRCAFPEVCLSSNK